MSYYSSERSSGFMGVGLVRLLECPVPAVVGFDGLVELGDEAEL
jgi:hypothetical protein